MADWPLLRNSRSFEDDTPLATYADTVTGGGSANTKGAYTELVASLPNAVSGIMLSVGGAVNQYVLFDIAIGAAGSEQVVVPNYGLPLNISSTDIGTIWIPVSIKAGSRVALRLQGSGVSYSLNVKAQFFSDHFVGIQPPTRLKDWGTDLTVSRGTNITANAAGDTKGSYTELVAASEFTTKWFAVLMQAISGARNFAVDIAIGGAGSEQVVIPNIWFNNNALSFIVGPLPFAIPGGSRISARCACSVGGSAVPVYLVGGA